MPAAGETVRASDVINDPVEITETTLLNTITNTTAANGTPVCGTTFVAPRSGTILLQVQGDLECPTAANAGLILTGVVRTGAVVGSGTIVYQGDTIGAARLVVIDTSGVAGDRVRLVMGSVFATVTGLTAGNTYNISTQHYVTGGTGIIRHRGLFALLVGSPS